MITLTINPVQLQQQTFKDAIDSLATFLKDFAKENYNDVREYNYAPKLFTINNEKVMVSVTGDSYYGLAIITIFANDARVENAIAKDLEEKAGLKNEFRL